MRVTIISAGAIEENLVAVDQKELKLLLPLLQVEENREYYVYEVFELVDQSIESISSQLGEVKTVSLKDSNGLIASRLVSERDKVKVLSYCDEVEQI